MSLEQYTAALAESGRKVVKGESGTLWLRSETFAMVRLPTFHVTPPTPEELNHVLWKGPAAVVSYVREPNEHHPPNACVYVCEDQSYDVEKLSKAARRDVRRALRNLVITPIAWPVLLDKGWQAFSETIARIGLSGGSYANFRRHYEQFAKNPCHKAIGAWKDDALVAFMTCVIVDDWVEIEGSFFSNSHRGLCPSNGLAHYVLDCFMSQQQFRKVSYGMSSIQINGQETGLHSYKTKVGFVGVPAHRVFVLHPFLRPFVNQLTLRLVKMGSHRMPHSRLLRKIEGVLALILGKQSLNPKVWS